MKSPAYLKKDRYTILFFTSIIIFIISIYFHPNKNNEQKSVNSALLNPKYKTEISHIQIKTGNKNINLTKSNEIWSATDEENDLSTVADIKNINSFLNALTKIGRMYHLSYSYPKLEPSSTIYIYKNEGSEFEKIDIYSQNALTSRILISNTKGRFYEIENDISNFLTSSIDFWSQSEIFFMLKKPTLAEFESSGRILRITDESTFSYLKSLRHGQIVHKNIVDFTKAETLKISDLHGNAIILHIFKDEEADNTYFLKKSYVKNNSQIYSDSASTFYEISSWTYNNLTKYFPK